MDADLHTTLARASSFSTAAWYTCTPLAFSSSPAAICSSVNITSLLKTCSSSSGLLDKFSKKFPYFPPCAKIIKGEFTLFPYSVLAASHKIQGNRQWRKFMSKTNNSPTPDTQIRKDKMRLTVTNIYPAFQKKSEQETRQEIGARLYQIFEKYA